MVKYLITGGCGFIGSHLVDLLLEEGHAVHVLDDLSNSTLNHLSKKASFYRGSILDRHVLESALKGVEGIFHLAACVSVPESIQHWHKHHLVNCAGTVNVIDCAPGIPFIYASSSAVYGDHPCLPQKENQPLRPLSPYAIDKLAGEMHLEAAWRFHQTPSVSYRFFNIYGTRQNPNSPYSGVISKFTKMIKERNAITIFGDGEQRRDFVSVKDVVRILAHTMSNLTEGARVYNLCTGADTSINELADLIGQIADVAVEKKYAPQRPGEILISRGDPSKLFKEKGIQAKIPLSEALLELVNCGCSRVEPSRH